MYAGWGRERYYFVGGNIKEHEKLLSLYGFRRSRSRGNFNWKKLKFRRDEVRRQGRKEEKSWELYFLSFSVSTVQVPSMLTLSLHNVKSIQEEKTGGKRMSFHVQIIQSYIGTSDLLTRKLHNNSNSNTQFPCISTLLRGKENWMVEW